MSDRTSLPPPAPVKRPLSRSNAIANIPQAEVGSPNPFLVEAPPTVGPMGRKQSCVPGARGFPPLGAAQPPAMRRFLTPIAMASRMTSAGSAPTGYSSFSSAYELFEGANNAHGPVAMPSPGFTFGGGDTDLEDESSDAGPSSPTRGPVGNHCDQSSLGSTLARRSTDASLVDGVAAGHMSIVPEEEEESDEDQASHQGEGSVGDEGSEEHGSASATPYAFNRFKGYVTPNFPTPAIARAEGMSSSSAAGFAFYDGVTFNGSINPYARSNDFAFMREPLTKHVYEMAKIKKFVPGVSEQRSPLMVLLHILSYITGGEGVSVEGFGRSWAECSTCNRFLFVDYQEVHTCVPTRGPTQGLTERGQIAPLLVLSWLVDRQGSLSKRDMDLIFALCNGCHHIILTCAGDSHPSTCTARKAASHQA